MQEALNFNDGAIVTIKRNNHRIHFFVYKQKGSHGFNNTDLTEKSKTL